MLWHVSQAYDIHLNPAWKWADVAYLLGFYALCNVLCMVALMCAKEAKPMEIPYGRDQLEREAPTLRVQGVRCIYHS